MKTIKLKSLLFILMMTTFTILSYSQTILINGQKSDGKLVWSDFTGKVDPSSSFDAFTTYRFKTSLGSIRSVGNSVIIDGFDMILELDQKQTWAKKGKTTDKLLVHEQGHFNIGILHVREITQRFKATEFTLANFESQFNKILAEVTKKYNELKLKYDKETDHSKNLEQQEKWNAFFQKELSN